MKIIIDIDKKIDDDEIIIKSKNNNDVLEKIKIYAESINNLNLAFYKKEQVYYLNLGDIIFFETYDNRIRAHTINDIYYIKYKLYELENTLPKNFIRISKSTIVNVNHIYSITKNITSSSLIEFDNTYKKVYVSRFYFKYLKERMKK